MRDNVIAFPIVPRPIPTAAEPSDEPHSLALVTMKKWTEFALKKCGVNWVEKVLLTQLSFVRARKVFESGEAK